MMEKAYAGTLFCMQTTLLDFKPDFIWPTYLRAWIYPNPGLATLSVVHYTQYTTLSVVH